MLAQFHYDRLNDDHLYEVPQSRAKVGGCDDVEPLALVVCPYCNGNTLRVRRGSFTIWSNPKTLNSLKPRAQKHQTVNDKSAYGGGSGAPRRSGSSWRRQMPHIHVYICRCVYIYIYIHIYISISISIYLSLSLYIYIYMHIHT